MRKRIVNIIVTALVLGTLSGCGGWDFGRALVGGETYVAHKQRLERERAEGKRAD